MGVLRPDLTTGVKSIQVTLSSNVGTCEIPDACKIVGVMPAANASNPLVGLEAPAVLGTKTGDALLTELTAGVLLLAGVPTYFEIGRNTGTTTRKLYFRGGASDIFYVSFWGM